MVGVFQRIADALATHVIEAGDPLLDIDLA